MPETRTGHSETVELNKPQPHMIGLNLLTVFGAMMQEQNTTRTAHILDVSQPAVSSAVAHLKIMFSDKLLIRHGRGTQPTARAFQPFGSTHQTLQLV